MEVKDAKLKRECSGSDWSVSSDELVPLCELADVVNERRGNEGTTVVVELADIKKAKRGSGMTEIIELADIRETMRGIE